MNVGDPRVLTNEDLLDFEQSQACQKSWYAKSLLLTIAAIREDHFYEMELVKVQISEANTRLRWFETTYSVRALEPMRRPRRGKQCPYCFKLSAGKFTIDGTEDWFCLACRERWAVATTVPDIGAAPTAVSLTVPASSPSFATV